MREQLANHRPRTLNSRENGLPLYEPRQRVVTLSQEQTLIDPPHVLRASRMVAKTERLLLQQHMLQQHERITEVPPALRSSRSRMILFGACGMLATLLVIGIANIVGGYVSDQWRYGDGRVTRLETVVGHHDDRQHPTELFAFESQSQIDLIELPGNDSKRAHVYHVGQVLTQQADHAIVKLSVKDVNGDGLLDVLVSVQDGSSQILYNNGITFQTTLPTKG